MTMTSSAQWLLGTRHFHQTARCMQGEKPAPSAETTGSDGARTPFTGRACRISWMSLHPPCVVMSTRSKRYVPSAPQEARGKCSAGASLLQQSCCRGGAWREKTMCEQPNTSFCLHLRHRYWSCALQCKSGQMNLELAPAARPLVSLQEVCWTAWWRPLAWCWDLHQRRPREASAVPWGPVQAPSQRCACCR